MLRSFFATLLVYSAAAQQECAGFFLLGLDLYDFSRYGEYFRNDSKLTLTQAGSYYGTDGIEEYVRFALASPFYDVVSLDERFGLKAYDNTTCTFYRLATRSNIFKPPAVPNASVILGSYVSFVYNIAGNYVSYVQVNFKPASIDLLFNSMTNTDDMRAAICETMRSSCPATWAKQAAQSIEDCAARIAALPTVEGPLAMFDGKSQGCRVLHGVFAATNAFHCPHISYESEEDDNGQAKCQVSDPDLDGLLDEADEAVFDAYLVSQNILVDQGFILLPTLPCSTNSDCPVGLICDLDTPPTSAEPPATSAFYCSMPPPPTPPPPTQTVGDPITIFQGREMRYWLSMHHFTRILEQGPVVVSQLSGPVNPPPGMEMHKGAWVLAMKVQMAGLDTIHIETVDPTTLLAAHPNATAPPTPTTDALTTMRVSVGGKQLTTGDHTLSIVDTTVTVSAKRAASMRRIGSGWVEQITITADGLELRITSAKANKFADEQLQVLGLHLDVEFLMFDQSAVRGALPEMWGLQPMTEKTRLLLDPKSANN